MQESLSLSTIYKTNTSGTLLNLLMVDRGPEKYIIHFYHSYNEKSHPVKRVFKPVYIDSMDGKEVFTSRPLPRFEAFTITVDNSRILLPYSFRLSSQGKVHAEKWSSHTNRFKFTMQS